MVQLRTDLLRYRIGIAAQEGAAPADILATAGAPPDMMEAGPDYVDGELELRIWSAIVKHTNRQDIGLICGMRFPTQVINMLGYAMANAPTMRVAIERCCAYQKLIGDSMGYVIEKGPNDSKISIELWSDWHDELRHTVDVMMSAIPSWASANAPAPIRPLRVGFHYQRPADLEPYHSFFSPSPVQFGAPESFQIYDNDVLDQPVIGANAEMFSYFDEKSRALLADHEGRDSFTFKTRQRIVAGLQGDVPDISTIASELAMSTRKLQQGLTNEGTSFSALLNKIRCDLAISYLKERRVDKSEIAYLLGYSEVSVFSRSFKKWTGKSPSEYQAQLPS